MRGCYLSHFATNSNRRSDFSNLGNRDWKSVSELCSEFSLFHRFPNLITFALFCTHWASEESEKMANCSLPHFATDSKHPRNHNCTLWTESSSLDNFRNLLCVELFCPPWVSEESDELLQKSRKVTDSNLYHLATNLNRSWNLINPENHDWKSIYQPELSALSSGDSQTFWVWCYSACRASQNGPKRSEDWCYKSAER